MLYGDRQFHKNRWDIAENIETRFDIWNYELERVLPKAKDKKPIGLMKDELGEKVMTKYVLD